MMVKTQQNKQNRTKLIAETLKTLRTVRQSLNPKVLEEAEKAIQTAQTAREPEDIKIDRKRNVKFVMAFLDSPEGAHLKDKIHHDC